MNTEPTAGQPPLIQDDFGDWLSPMLVKELRQGVRTKVFVSMFILLQALLLTVTAFSLLYASVSIRAEGTSTFFWMMVAFPVLIVLPMGGLNAIGGEVKANTLELIFLTRLTAWRIIVGKWLAIFVQSLLLVCTVLPYLVLRYFIGGINVSVELAILGVMLALSAVFSACSVGISGYPTRVVRTVSVIGGIFAFFLAIFSFGYAASGGRVTSSGPSALEWLEMFAGGALLLVVMLEIGVMKIAPPAENHSAVLRLLGFAALALSAAVALLARDSAALDGWRRGAGVRVVRGCVVRKAAAHRKPVPAVRAARIAGPVGRSAAVPGVALGSVVYVHHGHLGLAR